MLKWIATVVLNRLAFVVAVMLVLNAFARTNCYPGDNPVNQLGQALSSLKEIAQVLR
jgi:hypothetical protein